MEHQKCNPDAFLNKYGDFAVLPEYDLVLYKDFDDKIYCFTGVELNNLLKYGFNPYTKRYLSQTFIKNLQIYTDIKRSYLERIPGENSYTSNNITNLGWKEGINYCHQAFEYFLEGKITEQQYKLAPKNPNYDNCELYPKQFKSVAQTLASVFSKDELKKHHWDLGWHKGFPGVSLVSTIKRPDHVPVPENNVFNCSQHIYNEMCDIVTTHREITQFLIDPSPKTIEPFATTIIDKISIDVKRFKVTVVDNGTIRIDSPNGYWSLTGNGAKNALVQLQQGKIIESYKPDYALPNIGELITRFGGDMQKAGKYLAEYKPAGIEKELKIKYVQTNWTPEAIKKVIHDLKVYLGQTFKIHIQVKPEYQLKVLRRLFNVLNRADVRPYISAIKAVVPYTRVLSDKRIPAIVVYPIEGYKTAGHVLNAIAKEFDGYDLMGLGIVPRFNHTFNKLVYWASGHGDRKRQLQKAYLLDTYLDSSANWAHYLCGDQQGICHIQPTN